MKSHKHKFAKRVGYYICKCGSVQTSDEFKRLKELKGGLNAKMGDIPLFVENNTGQTGQDKVLIPDNAEAIGEKVNEQIQQGKMVTIEKEDDKGNTQTEVITNEVPKEDWGKSFGQTKSATSTNKMKGG